MRDSAGSHTSLDAAPAAESLPHGGHVLQPDKEHQLFRAGSKPILDRASFSVFQVNSVLSRPLPCMPNTQNSLMQCVSIHVYVHQQCLCICVSHVCTRQ